MSNPLADVASDWQTLDTTFYRHIHLYDLPWTVSNLDHHFVAIDKNGGSIAILRNPAIPTPYTTSSTAAPTIFIYTSSGLPVLQIPLSTQAGVASSSSSSTGYTSPVLFSYLSSTSQLLLLAEDGSYRLYAPNSATYETRQIGGELAVEGIAEGRTYAGGMVVRGNGGGFWDVPFEGGSGRGPRRLQSIDPTLGKLESWVVFEPAVSQTRLVMVVASVGSTIVTLDEEESIDQRISKGPFISIHPSPSGRILALVLPPSRTSSGPSIWVVSSDFQTNHASISYSSLVGTDPAQWEKSGGKKLPDQVEWCGDDAIALAWSRNTHNGAARAVICGPGGESMSFPHSAPVKLSSEIDGLRILSSSTLSFVQKVPSPLLSLLLPGSSHPSSLLLYAHTLFLAASPKSSTLLTLLRPDLSLAVSGCLEAASELWEPEQQRYVLKAALYGRAFLDGEGDAGIVERGKALKVLNCLRGWEVGVPISFEQYIRIPPSTLLSLLTSRSLHLLSLRIAQHLNLDPDPILEHWACAKINKAAGRDDAEVCREIVGKFGARAKGRGRYAGVAKQAWAVGRRGLATMLLDHEPRAVDQVPLLLSMKEERLALDKAVDSGDTDLVYHVLLHLKGHLALGDFFRIVDDRPTAAALLELYAREQDPEMLKDFYYQDDRRQESALLMLREGAKTKDITDRLAAIKAASKFFSDDKDFVFESKMMDESYRLLSLQQSIEAEENNRIRLAGLSVNETIRTLLVSGLGKKAERIRTEFKVPDRRFYYVKLQALVSIQDFPALEQFAKSKRSPIGYEPFVRELVKGGYGREGGRYVPRCEAKQRADLYVECGEWSAAAADCKDRGDKARLEALSRMAPTTLIRREMEAVLSSMTR